jgi:multidrug efflux pump subunit AcrA (membrane-fusion protein)
MSRTRLLIGIVVVLALAAVGYWGYQNYLAPQSTATPTANANNAPQPEAPSVVTAEGKITPAREATLAFRLSGRIAEILVNEGDPVEAGAPLIRLESAELLAAVAQAEAAVAQAEAAVIQAEAAVALAQAQYAQLVAGPRPEEVAALEAQIQAGNSAVWQAASQRNEVAKGATPDSIAAAEAQLAQAQAAQKEAQIAYDRIIENIQFLAGPTEEQARFQLNAANEAVAAAQAALDQLNAGPSQELIDSYNGAIGVAIGQRKSAEAQLALLQAGATEAQTSAAQAQVEQAEGSLAAAQAGLQAAQATLDAARAQLAQATLLAPFSGAVMNIEIEVGEVAAPGVPVLALADLSRWRMVTNDLAETDVVLVKPGQTALVTLDAFAGQTFTGTVMEIGAVAEVNRGNTTYPVTIELEAADAALRWGMTAFVDIAVGP